MTKLLIRDLEEVDGRGRSAVPGLVDCHTHACFAGDRVDDFSRRAAGATYEELHAAGGGILSTVRATRAAGEGGLAEALARHRAWMLAAGTTTFEAKSGYGLDRDTELAQLRVIREAGGIPTWLGAHAVPPEFSDAGAYLDFALQEVLPEAARLAEAADVFLERGVFEAAEARRYLEACRDAGLSLRLHADQFTEGGGVQLAIDLRARSKRCGGRSLTRGGALPRASHAARARPARGRRDRRPGHGFQPRQRVLRATAGGDDARVYPDGDRAGVRRERRSARQPRLATSRVPLRGRHRGRCGQGRRSRLDALTGPTAA